MATERNQQTEGERAAEGSSSSAPAIRVTEGDVRAAAVAASTTQMSGHNATVALWENSPEGKKFMDEEAPRREQEVKEEAKRIADEQARSDAAMKEYTRRVAANAEQTEAVARASQEATEAAVKKGEGQNEGHSNRTPSGAGS